MIPIANYKQDEYVEQLYRINSISIMSSPVQAKFNLSNSKTNIHETKIPVYA